MDKLHELFIIYYRCGINMDRIFQLCYNIFKIEKGAIGRS